MALVLLLKRETSDLVSFNFTVAIGLLSSKAEVLA